MITAQVTHIGETYATLSLSNGTDVKDVGIGLTLAKIIMEMDDDDTHQAE